MNFGALPVQPVSFEQFMRGSEAVFDMAINATIKSRLEASRMLYDLAVTATKCAIIESYVTSDACFTKVMESLRGVVFYSDYDDVQQHGIIALAKFCEIQRFKVSCWYGMYAIRKFCYS